VPIESIIVKKIKALENLGIIFLIVIILKPLKHRNTGIWISLLE
jgi:hypothetical protein